MRKIKIVAPKIQVKIILYAVLLNLISLGVFAGALKFYFQRYTSAAEAKGLPPDHLFFNFIGLQETYMWQVFAVIAVVSIILIALAALYASHSFVGPLDKMQNQLTGYISGQTAWRPMVLRKNDVLFDLSTNINKAIDHSNRK